MLGELAIVTGWRTDELVPRLTVISLILSDMFSCLDLGSTDNLSRHFVAAEYLHLACFGSHTPGSLVSLLLNHTLSSI